MAWNQPRREYLPHEIWHTLQVKTSLPLALRSSLPAPPRLHITWERGWGVSLSSQAWLPVTSSLFLILLLTGSVVETDKWYRAWFLGKGSLSPTSVFFFLRVLQQPGTIFIITDKANFTLKMLILKTQMNEDTTEHLFQVLIAKLWSNHYKNGFLALIMYKFIFEFSGECVTGLVLLICSL